jgi:NADH-quinone oxidoreductase subunit C
VNSPDADATDSAGETLSPRYARLAEQIEALFGASLHRQRAVGGELSYIVEPESLIEVCTRLRDTEATRFEMLIDVCGVDYQEYGVDEWATRRASGSGFSRGVIREGLGQDAADDGEATQFSPPGRFAVAYQLLSITHNWRLRLKSFCRDDEVPLIDSVMSVWSSADWFEREAFDLYGILFRGHPDLRRILTDYGFIGHPFRKDFPLSGHVEVLYDPEEGRVVYQPVSIEPRTLVPKVIRDDARYDPDVSGDDG